MRIQQNASAVNTGSKVQQDQLDAIQRGRVGKAATDTDERKNDDADLNKHAVQTSNMMGDARFRRGILLDMNSFEQATLAIKNAATPYVGLPADAVKSIVEGTKNNIISNAESALKAQANISPMKILQLINQ